MNSSAIHSLYVEADVDAGVGLAADVIEQSEVSYPLDGAESGGVEQLLQQVEVEAAPVEV